MNKAILVCFLIFIFSCKKEKDTPDTILTPQDEELTTLSKVANAYGFENWDTIEKVDFTFVVNPGENERTRKWTWEPKANRVTLHNSEQKITYNREELDEKFISTDKAFINDSYWLTVPFHLIWDDIEYKVEDNFETSIGAYPSTRITINYPDEGGYTPGDKYVIHVNDDFHILEWSYYPGGQENSVLTNTFEDLTEYNGIKVNLKHRNISTGFQLNFRDVSFE